MLTDDEIDAIFDAQYEEYGQVCDRLDFRMFARAVLAAEKAKAEPVWQPIETAPKDGTRIIVTNESVVWTDVKWVVRPRAGERWEHSYLGALGWEPTRWMPTPAAPTHPEHQGGER